MDHIDEHLATAATDPQYPLAIKAALAIGRDCKGYGNPWGTALGYEQGTGTGRTSLTPAYPVPYDSG